MVEQHCAVTLMGIGRDNTFLQTLCLTTADCLCREKSPMDQPSCHVWRPASSRFFFASASLPYLMPVSHACLWWDFIMSDKVDKRRHTSVQGTLLADPWGGWGFLIKGPGRARGVRPGPKQECNWVTAPHPKAAASADWRCNARILVVHLAGRERRLDRWTPLRVASTRSQTGVPLLCVSDCSLLIPWMFILGQGKQASSVQQILSF